MHDRRIPKQRGRKEDEPQYWIEQRRKEAVEPGREKEQTSDHEPRRGEGEQGEEAGHVGDSWLVIDRVGTRRCRILDCKPRSWKGKADPSSRSSGRQNAV